MFKISTTLALAALISVSTLSSADASRKIRGVEYDEVGTSSLRTLHGEERSRTLLQRTTRYNVEDRDESFFDDTDRRSSEYSLSRDEIYGQPSNNGYRGTSIGYSDDESFWSKNKGKIVAGVAVATVVTSALIYTAVKFMSGTTQDKQEEYTPNHPGVVYDPVLNFTADILAREAEDLVSRGLHLVASPDTAVAIYDPHAQESFMSSFVNVASSFFAPFSNMVFGTNN